MRKFLILMLCILFLLSFVSCNEDSNEKNSSVESKSSSKVESSTQEVSSAVNTSSSIATRKKLTLPMHYDQYLEELKNYGKFQHRYVSNDDIAYRLDKLISYNFTAYVYYVFSGLLIEGINDEVYPLNNSSYDLTYDQLCNDVKNTYIHSEAESIISDPIYGKKRYHYFEKDGVLYIDTTTAKKQNFIPYTHSPYTYPYKTQDYSFDYKQIDDNTIEIQVFFYDLVNQKYVKLPLKALKEEGKWKLEKMILEEAVTSID